MEREIERDGERSRERWRKTERDGERNREKWREKQRAMERNRESPSALVGWLCSRNVNDWLHLVLISRFKLNDV